MGCNNGLTPGPNNLQFLVFLSACSLFSHSLFHTVRHYFLYPRWSATPDTLISNCMRRLAQRLFYPTLAYSLCFCVSFCPFVCISLPCLFAWSSCMPHWTGGPLDELCSSVEGRERTQTSNILILLFTYLTPYRYKNDLVHPDCLNGWCANNWRWHHQKCLQPHVRFGFPRQFIIKVNSIKFLAR